MWAGIAKFAFMLLELFIKRAERPDEVIDPGPTIIPSDAAVFDSLGLRGGEDGAGSSWTTSSGTREPGDERPDSGWDRG